MPVAAVNADAVIGRDAELAAVTQLLNAAGLGPAALLIRGEPGIGKTTIWQAAVARAADASYTVVSCRPSSAETDLPYAGLGDLFDGVDDVMKALPAPQRRALDVALLRVDTGTSPLEQRAVSAAALHVLVALARSAPVLLAIDDLQWLDRPTVNVLRFGLRRIATARVAVLVASRSRCSEDDRLALGEALPPAQVHRLTVGPLDLSNLDQVLRSRLRTAFLGPALRRVHETSGGNPLFAIELARSLLDPDANAIPGQPFPAPSSLPELLAARLARISAPTRRVLLAASALARPTVDLVLTATASDSGTRASLDQAIDAEVVAVHGNAVRFTHPLLSSVVYAEASDKERRRLHRRLADLVADPEERARHLGLSATTPNDHIAATLEHAARRAASRGAPDAAAALLEQAIDLTPASSRADVPRRELEAADQHIAAGDTARARVILESLLSAADRGPTRARALHRCARVSALVGEMFAVPQLLRDALIDVGSDLPLRASIERDLVWSLAQVGEVTQLLPHADAALDAAQASGHPVLIAEALNHLCMTHCFAHGHIDPNLLDRAIRFQDQVGTAPPPIDRAIASGRLTLALALKWTDNFAHAREMLEALHTEHVEHGDEAAITPVLFHLGELEYWSGNWKAAARAAKECHELAIRSGQAVAELRAMTLDAMVACFRGTKDAVSISTAGLAIAEAGGDWSAMIRILKSVGVHELSIGNTEAAVDHLERGIALTKRGYDHRTVRIVPDAIEALIAAERCQEAAPLVDELDRAVTSDRPWALATRARCRGLLQAATGHLAEAEASLELAMLEHERLPRPFEQGRTLLCLGVVQRRLRRQRAARQSLNEACRIFETLGAARWTDRAYAESARIAGRASNALALTPTEEQVAAFVADGRTNHEVAAALFISVKTVESNLTRIYRKLGVSSRRELRKRIHGTQPSAQPFDPLRLVDVAHAVKRQALATPLRAPSRPASANHRALGTAPRASRG
jgi:DNA-binding CsgD family transcriptional regulator